jgi:hypothetical protein
MTQPELPPAGPVAPTRTAGTVEKGFDALLSVQRPVVLAHLRAIRSRRPDATPDEVIAILEKRYLAAVTSGGAAVGVAAAIPAVGLGASLALSGVETAGFLEASALFAQSVTEVHGIALVEPERARTLVMTMILGNAGTDLLRQFASQAAGTGPSRSVYWGELVTRNLPGPLLSLIADKMKQAFLRRFAANQGANIIGRAIPFGIGAGLGAVGNHLLGRKVVNSSRTAFGPAPATFPSSLEVTPKAPKPPKAVTAPTPATASRAGRRARRGVGAPTAPMAIEGPDLTPPSDPAS